MDATAAGAAPGRAGGEDLTMSRVLHLIGSNCIGGPEKQILHHAVSMQGSPYQIEVGSFHDQQERPEILRGAEERNIPTVCLKGGVRLDLASELSAILNQRKGVLLCTHGFKANVIGYLAARRTGTRHVAFLRGWTAETMRVALYEVMERYVLSRAPMVVCVSQKQAERVRRMRRGRREPIVVPNAMIPPWSRQNGDPQVSRSLLHIPESNFIFGSVGRLSAEKGHRYLISAFHQLSSSLQGQRKLSLIIVGDGREQKQLERLAAELGIGDQVYFAGFQGNPADWMNLFDCMVQPSLTEGTPNSVLEALCLGVPVVATAVGGVPALIDDGSNGLLVPPKNAGALAEAMNRVVVDADLRSRLAAAAGSTDSVYSPSTQREKLIAVYEMAFAS
jgi:glycosyltransferase involved in cell wall biosynthesis